VPLLIAGNHAADLGQMVVAQLLRARSHYTVRNECRALHEGGVHEPQVGVVLCFGVLSNQKERSEVRHDVPKCEFESLMDEPKERTFSLLGSK
jgi:hypothetical protein